MLELYQDILTVTVNGLALGCIYGLIALGFVLIYKATEMVNFAQGDLMMLGAFVAYTLIDSFGFDYWVGLLGAIILMAVFGYILDALLLRRVIDQPQFAVVMLTLGLGFVIRSAAGVTFSHDPVVFETPFTNKVVRLTEDLVIGQENIAIVVGTIVLCSVLYVFFRSTRLGVAMQAASQNQLAAYYMGIPVKVIFSLIWAISAGVAVVAGVLVSPLTLIDPDMGSLAIKAFAAAVLGGFGSIPGAVIGGIIIGIIEQGANLWLPAGFGEVSAFVVLLAVLIIRPQGLFGQVGRKKV